MSRYVRFVFAFAFFIVPLFPAFITLTAVTIPGVCLIPMPLTLAILALCALAAAVLLLAVLQPPRERPPTLVPLLLWLGAALLSGAVGFNPLGGLLFIGIFGLGVIWHLSLLRYYALPGAARWIVWSYLLSGTLSAILAIVMVVTRIPADQYTIGHGRAIGTFILPGELAGYLIIFLPIAFGVARVSNDRNLRALALAGLVFGTLAFVLTFSRAGWMGLAAAVAFYAFVTGSVARRYALAIPVLGLLAVLVAFNAHHNPSENYTRLSIWQAGLEIVRRFPLTGVGPLDFARVYALVRMPDGDQSAFHAHSFLLTIFAETGVIGLLVVLYAWGRFVVALRDSMRGASRDRLILSAAVAAGLLGTWVQGLIDTVSVVIFGLWLPSMALALVAARYGLLEEER